MTSHDVVARVRKIIGERRVGHTGTLDPFATGVLVLLTGRATRLAQFLSGAEKEYEAVIRLGYATDTGDMTGAPMLTDFTAETQRPPELLREQIEAAMASLSGEIEQVPPMYSAKKIEGRRLYELARRGQEVERQPVRITIHDFTALGNDGLRIMPADNGACDLPVRVVCSAGTYVRALAEDFGKRLGCGAHLAALRRTRAGHFRIEDALTLERLSELVEANEIGAALISPDAAIPQLPAVTLSADELKRVLNGVKIPAASHYQDQQCVRLRNSAGKLVAVGMYEASGGSIHPRVVLQS